LAVLTKFRRKKETTVTAVRLDLETEGFTYRKWGGIQHCKAGDFIVNNGGETYTVDAESFARTYREVSPGVYQKDTPIWAERAEAAGVIATKEGQTAYQAGDMLVFSDTERNDGYAISLERFESLYEPAE
jgi:hypothetical protein